MKIQLILPLFILGTLSYGNDIPSEWEGVYQSTIICNPSETNALCHETDSAIDVVLIKISENEIRASVVDAEGSQPRYQFKLLRNSANSEVFEGNSLSTGSETPAEIQINFDPQTPHVVAWIRDPAFQFDLRINGTQRINLHLEVAETFPPLNLQSILGVFQGDLGEVKGLLTIRKFLSEPSLNTIASFVPRGTGQRINFASGLFYPKRGVVELVGSVGMAGAPLKWTLSHELDSSGETVLKGVSVSLQDAKIHTLNFSRR